MNKKAFLFLSLIVLLTTPIVSAITVEVRSPQEKAEYGMPFNVEVYVIPSGQGVYGGQFTLHFPASCFEIPSETVESGLFLTADGQGSAVVANIVKNEKGTVEYGEARIGRVPGVSEPGTFATAHFNVKQCGYTGEMEFSLSDVKFEIIKGGGSPDTDPNPPELKPLTVDVTSPEPPETTAPPETTEPSETTVPPETTPPPVELKTPAPTIAPSTPASTAPATQTPTTAPEEKQPLPVSMNLIILAVVGFAILTILIGYLIGRRK